MSYHIKYEDLTNVRGSILRQLEAWSSQLNALRPNLLALSNMTEIKGKTGSNVRTYFREVHINLVDMILSTIETYRSSLILYTDMYYRMESDMMAELPAEEIEEQFNRLVRGKSSYDTLMEEYQGILRELSYYMSTGSGSPVIMDDRFDHAINCVRDIYEGVGAYEESHRASGTGITNEMAEHIRTIISGQLTGSSVTISEYRMGSMAENETYQQAQALNALQETYITQVKEKVEEAGTIYEDVKTNWEKELAERKEQGIMTILNGVGSVIAGAVLIAVTAGATTPLVAGAVVVAGGAVFYGTSTMEEGYNSIKLAEEGDARGIAFNPIRDTIFANNPELYYTIGNFCVMTAGVVAMSVPIRGAVNAALATGTSATRAGLIEVGKMGISMGAGAFVQKEVTERTGNEFAGCLWGLLGGMVSYGGLGFLDTRINVSGLYPKTPVSAVSQVEVQPEGPKVDEEAYDYYKKLVEELDVSTEANTATFYSGPGNRIQAEAFARSNGKVTLEMTKGGKYLDDLNLFNSETSPLTGDQAREVWAKLSRRYAEQASGNAYGFVEGSDAGGIFNVVEYPALQKNSNVTNIFTELFKGGK